MFFDVGVLLKNMSTPTLAVWSCVPLRAEVTFYVRWSSVWCWHSREPDTAHPR